MNNREVGWLDKESNGVPTFRYSEQWLDWPSQIPVSLSLPLQRRTYTGGKVTSVFENMLPDVETVRRSIATRVGASGTDAHALLAKIGQDCVGALQFVAEDDIAPPTGSIQGVPITEDQIENLLLALNQNHLGMGADDGFRISIAGAQEKTALLRHDGQWFKPLGTTPTTHIFKPAIGIVRHHEGTIDLRNSVENEFYCLKVLEAFGLKVPNITMETFGKTKVLIVERFDRVKTADGRLIRLPQEDFCQALGIGPTQKYQSHGGPNTVQILKFLQGSDNWMWDQFNFFKSLILFWLIGATDGHGKNFSLHLRSQGRYALTPLYDVLSAQPHLDAAQIRHKHFKLAMSVGQSRHYDILGISRRHFLETAKEADLDLTYVRAMIDEVVEGFEARLMMVEAMLPKDFPQDFHATILKGVRSRIPKLAMLD